MENFRSSHPRCSVKKLFLEISQNSQENTCARASFLIKFSFIKKETLVQVFSCEFCEISKNTFSYRTPPVAAFETLFFVQCVERLLDFRDGFRTLSNIHDEDIWLK